MANQQVCESLCYLTMAEADTLPLILIHFVAFSAEPSIFNLTLSLASISPITWTPWRFFLVAIAGWMNRQQQEAIAYLKEENRILREKLGQKRILLTVSQKRRLAMAAARLPRHLLREVGTLFSPDTLLRWHRWLIARKYDGSGAKKPGPAPTKQRMIRDMVLRMAEDNPDWGYGRMYGELKKLGYKVHWQTVRRVMLDHGLLDDQYKPPRTSWKTFLASHWESISACDFFTVEAWTKAGLTRFKAGVVQNVVPARFRGEPYRPTVVMLDQPWCSASDFGFRARIGCGSAPRSAAFCPILPRWRHLLTSVTTSNLRHYARIPTASHNPEVAGSNPAPAMKSRR